jgi:LmbE family N-acetylglucosaminyl deacetylase
MEGSEVEMRKGEGQETALGNTSDYPTSGYCYCEPGKALMQDLEVNSNSRVLVLAPHHDDPIIGCGGTMCKMAMRGAHVKVLYMTDCSYESNIGPSCGLVPIDPKEAEESLARLRCFEAEHLDLPGMGILCNVENRRRLYRVIEYYSPDLVFIPSLQDMHPDNKMTGLLAAHALKEYDGCLTLYSYEVWGGLFPNIMVEITDVMEEKIAALKARHSQAKLVDVERRLRKANDLGLGDLQEARYGEPFLRQVRQDYMTMARRLGAYDPEWIR